MDPLCLDTARLHTKYRKPYKLTPAQSALLYSSQQLSESSTNQTGQLIYNVQSTSRSLQHFKNSHETVEAEYHRIWAQKTARVLKRRKPYRSFLEKLDKYYNGQQFGSFSWMARLLRSSDQLSKLIESLDVNHMVKTWFPPRPLLPVYVCDFYADYARKSETTVGNMESFWKEKPTGVIVRWLHAPLGEGLVHSSIEDMFRHDQEMGKEFVHTGFVGFPYIEMEVLDFRHVEEIQDLRNIYRLCEDKNQIETSLNKDIFQGDRNETFREDLKWRSKHLGTPSTFLRLAAPDVPLQLAESIDIREKGPVEATRYQARPFAKGALRNSTFFDKAQLCRSDFRCFHRKDGILLTMSSGSGVHYINRNFTSYINAPSEIVIQNKNANVIAALMEEFRSTGTSAWHKPTVEWLLTYVITELAPVPHTLRQGRNAISIPSAFRSIIEELKNLKYGHWDRSETPELVVRFATCGEELSELVSSLKRRLQCLGNLEMDIKSQDEESHSDEILNEHAESSQDRINWAKRHLESNITDFERLSSDLSNALSWFSQMRNLEQNTLAAENNRNILAFTYVTIVFLPLNFLSSYFGMNLSSIIHTSHSERFFWAISGAIAAIVCTMMVLFSLRKKLKTWVLSASSQREVRNLAVTDGQSSSFLTAMHPI